MLQPFKHWLFIWYFLQSLSQPLNVETVTDADIFRVARLFQKLPRQLSFAESGFPIPLQIDARRIVLDLTQTASSTRPTRVRFLPEHVGQ